MDATNRIAIVTGGASGFGEAIVERLAGEGMSVLIADLNGDRASDMEKRLNSNLVAACRCDVADGQSYARMVETCSDRFGVPTLVVNNAGYTHPRGRMEDVDEDEYDRTLNVNVKALYHCGKSVVPMMKSAGTGHIINIASTAALRPGMALTWYAASKGAVVTATQAMAMELAPAGIRVNAIAPVIGETPLLERFVGEKVGPEIRKRFGDSIPLGRFCQPADIADAVKFLDSAEAAFINGHCLPVDGGWLAGAFSMAAAARAK